jgi:PAS domain S-box-containing protein
VRVSYIPEFDVQNEVTGWVASIVDINDRKHAEVRLRESEDRYRAIVECQDEMVCRFRLDGTILFANGAYSRSRAAAPEALVGASFWDFVEPGDQPAVRAMLEGLSPQSPQVQIENRFATSAGFRWTLWTNRALEFDDDGRALEVQSSGVDITQRKQMEHSLRFLAEASKSLSTLVDYRSTLQQIAQLAVPTFADWCAVDILNDQGSLERLAVAHVDPEKVQLAEDLYRRYGTDSDPNTPRGVMRLLMTGRTGTQVVYRRAPGRQRQGHRSDYIRLGRIGPPIY